MIKSIFIKSSVVILGFLLFSSCTPNVKFKAPIDIFNDWCKSYGEISGAKIYCEPPNVNDSSRKVNRSLVVFIEPGTSEANSTVEGAPFAGMLKNSDVKVIAPYIRTIMINMMASFVEKIQTNFKGYQSIYVVRGDSNLKRKLFDAIKHAATTSNEVDLFLMAHGSQGVILANPNLDKFGETITSADIRQFANSELAEASKKIKSVFPTMCFAASGSDPITQAFKSAFSESNVYGARGVNFFPLHRDFVAFEEFQKNRNFQESINLGNYVISHNVFNNEKRKVLAYPAIVGEGCVDLIFTDKCEKKTFPMGSTFVSDFMIDQSIAVIENTYSLPMATPTVATLPPLASAAPAAIPMNQITILPILQPIQPRPAIGSFGGGGLVPLSCKGIGQFVNEANGDITEWACDCPESIAKKYTAHFNDGCHHRVIGNVRE